MTILIQLAKINLPISIKSFILLNTSLVLFSRIILALIAYIQVFHCITNTSLTLASYSILYNKLRRNSNPNKLQTTAYIIDAIATTIAVIIQILAIIQIIIGNFKIINDNTVTIHLKGKIDLMCLFTKLIITSPLLIYDSYYQLQGNHINKKIHNQLKTLLYLRIAMFIISVIGTIGKIINILEQTEHFYLYKISNINNITSIFPLGPIIRIICTIASIGLTSATYITEVSVAKQKHIQKNNTLSTNTILSY
ncbi:hypothetical protein [Candidatus Neoehrlichia procyonis]|uniref:hypothetical protein n=1 Tax=Candidatus Neoehrlichia procyonis TaxID=467750 RepID=UPI0018DB4C08|nr:hypothetical protein [Candidatus Neoehrlichia lotoris]